MLPKIYFDRLKILQYSKTKTRICFYTCKEKEMKRLIACGICIAMLGVLVGCTNKGVKKPRIGVVVYKYDDSFITIMRSTINAASKNKAELLILDGKNSQPIQNKQVDRLIERNVDVLAVNIVDRSQALPIIKKARKANLPIVFFNREPFAQDLKSYDKAFYVGALAEQSGTMQGQLAVNYFNKNPQADKNRDGIIQYVMLEGEPGHQDAELRSKYSILAMENSGKKIEKLASETARWNREDARKKTSEFLTAFGDSIELILANNDDMALGAMDALKIARYYQDKKYIPIIGVDATTEAVEAIRDGYLYATILNDAKGQAAIVFKLAYELALGNPASECGEKIVDGVYIWVPSKMVTKENYTDFD
ncbi:hypothetical protein HMPREF9554_01853 [Treponema phagedenis F0421]|nr:hypothetical protein HMPREF9554_01853 [Treponema phagedenis F0421]